MMNVVRNCPAPVSDHFCFRGPLSWRKILLSQVRHSLRLHFVRHCPSTHRSRIAQLPSVLGDAIGPAPACPRTAPACPSRGQDSARARLDDCFSLPAPLSFGCVTALIPLGRRPQVSLFSSLGCPTRDAMGVQVRLNTAASRTIGEILARHVEAYMQTPPGRAHTEPYDSEENFRKSLLNESLQPRSLLIVSLLFSGSRLPLGQGSLPLCKIARPYSEISGRQGRVTFEKSTARGPD